MRYFSLLAVIGLLTLAACEVEQTEAAQTTPTEVAPPVAVHPGTYTLDRSHSEIGFVVRHLGLSNVRGTFDDYSATIEFEGKS